MKKWNWFDMCNAWSLIHRRSQYWWGFVDSVKYRGPGWFDIHVSEGAD